MHKEHNQVNPVLKGVENSDKLPHFVEQEYGKRKISPFGHLFRFIGWWFGFTGLYTMFYVCPFCGQQGCPLGLTSAGTVGAFLSLCFQDWKRLISFIKNKIRGEPKALAERLRIRAKKRVR